jgi:hypothetical protein
MQLGGEDNLIRRAYDLRSAPILLEKPPEFLDTEPGLSATNADLHFVVHRAGRRLNPTPFVATEPWLSKMKKALDPKDMLRGETAEPAGGPTLQERGDALATVLAQRLQKHIMSRFPSKKDHWVWDFVLDNMTRMAVIMEHMGHIRRDADIAHNGKKDDRCLLKKPEAFRPAAG